MINLKLVVGSVIWLAIVVLTIYALTAYNLYKGGIA